MIFKIKICIFIIFSIFVNVSCINKEVTNTGLYFNQVIEKYYKGYNYDENISINKPYSKYSVTKVDKDELSLNDFKKIDSQLKKDGWNLISYNDNFYEYCFGTDIYMGALYPIKDIYLNFSGNTVKPYNKNKWLIILSYGEKGIEYCRTDIEKISLD